MLYFCRFKRASKHQSVTLCAYSDFLTFTSKTRGNMPLGKCLGHAAREPFASSVTIKSW